MFQVLCLMVLKLIIVSRNNLQAFSLPPLILKLKKKTINERAKIQTPHLATTTKKQVNVALSFFCRAEIMDTFTY